MRHSFPETTKDVGQFHIDTLYSLAIPPTSAPVYFLARRIKESRQQNPNLLLLSSDNRHFMKQDIHPTYYPEAKISCACGKSWKSGSTKSDLDVAICSNCHPFYTGRENLVDARGRVERFAKRMEKSAQKATSRISKAPRAKKNAKKSK